MTDDNLKLALQVLRIGNRAVRKAQKRNHELGLPNVYSLNGVLYYQLPDGTITMDDPLDDEIVQPPEKETN